MGFGGGCLRFRVFVRMPVDDRHEAWFDKLQAVQEAGDFVAGAGAKRAVPGVGRSQRGEPLHDVCWEWVEGGV